MTAPRFDGYPAAPLPESVNTDRYAQWRDLEAWLHDAPVAESDAWLAEHPTYHGPSTPLSTWNLRRAGRMAERDGQAAASAWLNAVEDAAALKITLAAAEAEAAARAPRPVDRAVDGTIATVFMVPIGAVVTFAAWAGFGPHAAVSAATFTGGLALLHGIGAAIAARRGG